MFKYIILILLSILILIFISFILDYKKAQKERLNTIDLIRGIAILNMIIYHALWNLAYIFGVEVSLFYSSFAYIWQQLICCTFIILAGFCHFLSKNPLKRGLITLFCSFLISFVTILIMPENKILFGILNLIGSLAIILTPFTKLFKKAKPLIAIFISIFLFILTKHINKGYLALGNFVLLNINSKFYNNLITAYFGFPPSYFYSSDYFPILPWIFLYIFGYFLYIFLKQKNWLIYLKHSYFKPLERLGKSSLVIYMLHQVVLYLIFNIFLAY